MKKCCFIVAYFGKMPNYFNLFLKTCSKNINYNWLIVTDDTNKYKYPNNVIPIYMKFEELKKYIQKKFDFKISLDKPYKLCDYKPAYGYIFEEYIKDYKYWGHCDIDTLMGDLDKFLAPILDKKYDKIFCLGHMVIYKNNKTNNQMFMSKIDNKYWYKEVYTNSKNLIFDEPYNNVKNINEIYERFKKNIFQKDLSLNFKVLPTHFVTTTYDSYSKKFIDKYEKALYTWENGKIYKYYIKNKELQKEEYMYMHLQERKMKYSNSILNTNIFKVIPNSFLPLEFKEVSKQNFKKIKKNQICFHYIQYKIKWQKKKIERILGKGSKKYE